MIKTTSPEDVICIYNNAKEMLSIINNKFYTNTLFCCKYRIYKNILKLLYIDVVRFYRICYFCVSESLNNIKKLDVEQAKGLLNMCKSFIEVTAETQKQVGGMSSQLKEPLPVLINYFSVSFYLKTQPKEDLIKNIEEYIKVRQEMPKEEEYPEGEDEYNFGERHEDEYDLDDVKGEYNLYEGKEDEYDLADKKEDEYDLEDRKGEDEFNIESKGLDDFMTSVKQSAAPNFGPPQGQQYNTTVPQHTAYPPAKSNDFFILDDPQPTKPPAPAPAPAPTNAGFGSEFDDLFGDRPIASKPAAQYTTTYNQPAGPSYDQFNSYYATYQQPSTTQNPYNPYAPQPQMPPTTKAASPFDQIQSSYSELKPNPSGNNDNWF